MATDFQITVLSGVSAGDVFTFSLKEGQRIVIGREQTSDLCLQDPMVSRAHAEVRYTGGQFTLCDLGSSHGTIFMGFQLRSGEEGRTPLKNEDEFKIGAATFRFEAQEGDSASAPSTPGRKRLTIPLTPLRGAILGLGAVVLLALLWLTVFQESAPSLPPQLSHVPLNLPYERVAGYLPGAAGPGSDTQHIDKVLVTLPPTDLLIEFDYISQSALEISVNESLVEKLPQQPAGWEQHAIIFRDAARGAERRLVIDNVSYPPAPQGGLKRWGVRNIRVTPLARGTEPQMEASLLGTVALVDQLNKTPDSYYRFLRSLQRSILLGLDEAGMEAVGYRVQLDSLMPSLESLRQRFEGLRAERLRGITAQVQSQHLQELLQLAGDFDAELWRRTHLAVAKARSAVERKDHIDAHDLLLALREIVPEESDYRRAMVDKLFNDNKFIPAKVRNSPERFRRAQKP